MILNPCLSYVHVCLAFFIDIVCTSVVCDVNGELCTNDVCTCGSTSSCAGNPTGEYCDATNSVCKCSENVDSCQQGQICTNGKCGRLLFINALIVNFIQLIVNMLENAEL